MRRAGGGGAGGSGAPAGSAAVQWRRGFGSDRFVVGAGRSRSSASQASTASRAIAVQASSNAILTGAARSRCPTVPTAGSGLCVRLTSPGTRKSRSRVPQHQKRRSTPSRRPDSNSQSSIVSKVFGAQGRNRTTDTAIFSRMLYQLSYLGVSTLQRPEPARL